MVRQCAADNGVPERARRKCSHREKSRTGDRSDNEIGSCRARIPRPSYTRRHRNRRTWKVIVHSVCALVFSSFAAAQDTLNRVTLSAVEPAGRQTVCGRILLTARDGGILLEEPNGTIHNLIPSDFVSITDSEAPFAPLTADELATDLRQTMGPDFRSQQTDHYVICSAASQSVTQFVAELLEKVYSEYFKFFADSGVTVNPADGPLAVIVFGDANALQQHARQRHPEITFEDVPGYYSSRFNQTYVNVSASEESRSRLSRELKKQPRTVETIVHEAVHQLGYNSGLHVRFADNPLWFTEGLALYFEPLSGRGRLLWSGPGRTNGLHLRHLNEMPATQDSTPLTVLQLIQDNRAFLQEETAADAYALSWGLVYHLIERDRPAFVRLATSFQQRSPLIDVTAEREAAGFEESAETSPDQLDREIRQTIRRLRSR